MSKFGVPTVTLGELHKSGMLPVDGATDVIVCKLDFEIDGNHFPVHWLMDIETYNAARERSRWLAETLASGTKKPADGASDKEAAPSSRKKNQHDGGLPKADVPGPAPDVKPTGAKPSQRSNPATLSTRSPIPKMGGQEGEAVLLLPKPSSDTARSQPSQASQTPAETKKEEHKPNPKDPVSLPAWLTSRRPQHIETRPATPQLGPCPPSPTFFHAPPHIRTTATPVTPTTWKPSSKNDTSTNEAPKLEIAGLSTIQPKPDAATAGPSNPKPTPGTVFAGPSAAKKTGPLKKRSGVTIKDLSGQAIDLSRPGVSPTARSWHEGRPSASQRLQSQSPPWPWPPSPTSSMAVSASSSSSSSSSPVSSPSKQGDKTHDGKVVCNHLVEKPVVQVGNEKALRAGLPDKGEKNQQPPNQQEVDPQEKGRGGHEKPQEAHERDHDGDGSGGGAAIARGGRGEKCSFGTVNGCSRVYLGLGKCECVEQWFTVKGKLKNEEEEKKPETKDEVIGKTGGGTETSRDAPIPLKEPEVIMALRPGQIFSTQGNDIRKMGLNVKDYERELVAQTNKTMLEEAAKRAEKERERAEEHQVRLRIKMDELVKCQEVFKATLDKQQRLHEQAQEATAKLLNRVANAPKNTSKLPYNNKALADAEEATRRRQIIIERQKRLQLGSKQLPKIDLPGMEEPEIYDSGSSPAEEEEEEKEKKAEEESSGGGGGFVSSCKPGAARKLVKWPVKPKQPLTTKLFESKKLEYPNPAPPLPISHLPPKNMQLPHDTYNTAGLGAVYSPTDELFQDDEQPWGGPPPFPVAKFLPPLDESELKRLVSDENMRMIDAPNSTIAANQLHSAKYACRMETPKDAAPMPKPIPIPISKPVKKPEPQAVAVAEEQHVEPSAPEIQVKSPAGECNHVVANALGAPESTTISSEVTPEQKQKSETVHHSQLPLGDSKATLVAELEGKDYNKAEEDLNKKNKHHHDEAEKEKEKDTKMVLNNSLRDSGPSSGPSPGPTTAAGVGVGVGVSADWEIWRQAPNPTRWLYDPDKTPPSTFMKYELGEEEEEEEEVEVVARGELPDPAAAEEDEWEGFTDGMEIGCIENGRRLRRRRIHNPDTYCRMS
ncbi:hypothetical protein B0H63DRAFT_543788 [Podospora didyma]|uniref:Uncharacterized protein n=1 Tax=Podospora didyma TaxID=330526 RepID=A0AAE0NPQ9_9PEZI|nr:hypothetical protein B0H63DRAFT_543788 [Podospora didyma]